MDKDKQKKINRNNRARGGKFEKRVADFLGFEVVPYSGSNARFGYGDVRNDEWLIECKNITPDGDKITIKQSWMDKNRERANDVGKKSCIAWMPAGKSDKFIVMEHEDFVKMGILPTYVVRLHAKVHNTKNLILHMSESYIKDVRQGAILRIIFNDTPYYMMSLQKFKEVINNGNENE